MWQSILSAFQPTGQKGRKGNTGSHGLKGVDAFYRASCLDPASYPQELYVQERAPHEFALYVTGPYVSVVIEDRRTGEERSGVLLPQSAVRTSSGYSDNDERIGSMDARCSEDSISTRDKPRHDSFQPLKELSRRTSLISGAGAGDN